MRILDAAARELARLDRSVARRVVERLKWLAANLDALNLEALSGSLAGLYKLRAGDYRILHQVLRDEQTLVVHAIGHRREIYRRR
ncbi:MAG: type II toxin-antitoxin system RelE/ParE family toxin [Chloroflexi bacterium]|nr:type II toxin-antitoxin system RelE/ParE family toxin [Chloroflexota bacterium]